MKSEEGFLLLELLVALLVLAIVAGPLISLLVLGAQTLESAGAYTVAANLAREKMEEIKGGGYGGAECFVDVVGGVRREVEVTQAACAEGEMALKEVVVRVFWQDGVLEREVRFVTFLSGR